MNIPDKAIEAIYDSRAARAYLDGEDLEVIGRAILEAAAPYLYAQALRDAEDMILDRMPPSSERGAARILLTDRADDLEATR